MIYKQLAERSRSPIKKIVLVVFTIGAMLVASAVTSPQLTSAHDGRHGDRVTVIGTVLIVGWTPPGIAEVQLCAGGTCQTTTTDNFGRFEFRNVPHSTMGSIKAGFNCSWERWINDPFFDTVDVHLLSCML